MKKLTDVKLVHVNTSEIEPSKTNQTLRSKEDFEGSEFDGLMASILEKGILQPILIRPVNGKYEIIAGERRYRAAVKMGFKTVPTQIIEMTDDEAINAQISENVQRKDIHPMAEARAYYELLQNYPNEGEALNIETIAKRFNKLPEYVAKRLKLLDLIPKLAERFERGDMGLTHALMLCRLSKQDQEEWEEDNRDTPTVAELKRDIEQSISLNLKDAAFSKTDATLNPERGACTDCSLRSGANPLLFGDIKSKDRCFNSACFKTKQEAHLGRAVQEVIETKPDTYLLTNYSSMHPVMEKLLEKHKIKPLKEYEDFNTDERDGAEKAKGLWVSGSESGRTVTIYLRKKSKEEKVVKGKKVSETESIENQINEIKAREKRACELDEEKIYDKILEGLGKVKLMDKPEKPVDLIIARWLVIQLAGFGKTEKVVKEMGVKESDKSDYLDSIYKLTDKQFNTIARHILYEKFSSNGPAFKTAAGKLVRMMTEQHKLIDVDPIVKEQGNIAAQRKERVAIRIKALKNPLK